ncbi:TLDc domain-containing protein [Entamoeba marina]
MGQTTSNCSSPETIEIEILKKWSGFDDFTLIFDSDAHGNGFESLEKTVINKCNLYFIAFDDHENVFGGYVDTYVDKVNKYINDSNAFVFSLFREGELRNEKYQIKKGNEAKAFIFYSNSDNLFVFGFSDVIIFKVGDNKCYSEPWSFNYNNQIHPINNSYPHMSQIQRIIVVEME